VLDEEKIKKYYIRENHIVISVASPNTKYPELPKSESRMGLLQLTFSDVDKEIDNPKVSLFNQKHAKSILDFFQCYKRIIKTVICQCEAGISRSSAIAAALSKIIGQSDDKYFKYYIPNRFIYRLLLEEGTK
jgi:predicted protein tyrosine phosphatase